MPYQFSWDAVVQASGALAAGLLVSLQLILASAVAATVIGLIGALAMRASHRGLRWSAIAYLEAMRNSPSMVKMYFIFFGLPELGFFPSPFWSGVAALALHNGAYMMDVFRAAFGSVPSGQAEAAMSLGLGRYARLRTVLWPQALRRALPGLGNYWSEIVKDTSITSALSVKELYFVVISEISLTQRTYEFFLVAGSIYLLLTMAVTGAVRLGEWRLGRADAAARS